jgi:hypothetical protein
VVAIESGVGGRVVGHRGMSISVVTISPIPWCWWYPCRLSVVVLPLLGCPRAD